MNNTSIESYTIAIKRLSKSAERNERLAAIINRTADRLHASDVRDLVWRGHDADGEATELARAAHAMRKRIDVLQLAVDCTNREPLTLDQMWSSLGKGSAR